MSRIHLRSNTLVLWLSLSAIAATSALLSVGCSSSDDPAAPASAGKGGGSSGGASSVGGSTSSEAGEAAVGGEPGEPGESGGSGNEPVASGGSGGSGGSAAGGSSNGTDAGAPGEGGAGGSAEVVDPEVEAAQARAVALIEGLGSLRKCTACHDPSYKGAGFYPNITPDVETGIGSWTDDEIKAAISDGKDKDGKTLCATMERYTFTDAQVSDIVVFLKHLPAVSKTITAKCPSL